MIYGFDVFFRNLENFLKKDPSKKKFNKWYKTSSYQLTYKQLLSNIKKRKFTKIKPTKGYAETTIPKFFEKKIKISLIDLDFAVYNNPSEIALEKSWPMLSKNGIIIVDNVIKYLMGDKSSG